MTRTLGALLLAAGAGGLGLLSALRLRRQAVALRQLSFALGFLRSEISGRLTPLPQLMGLAAARTEGAVRLFFLRAERLMGRLGDEPFLLLWRRALAESTELACGTEGLRTMEEAGAWLGRYDAGEQAAALERAVGRMGELAAMADAQCAREGRLRTAVGLAAGVSLAVLLL